MFECKIRIIPLMGRSVCEVVTARGTHTAIAPTHRESFKAGMTMAKIAMMSSMEELQPVEAEAPSDLEVALMAAMKGSIVENECQCPECKARQGEVPNGPRHH